MLVCIGCGGRNLPELEVCPFCHRRLGQTSDSRAARVRLASIAVAGVVLAVLVVVVLLVLGRTL